ncbi:MAG: flippase-like domain-containing protein [Deltaproteobacteria bacterium]|nr:flippase-like domain-containing protein [Deltaproteobacteria bacterium]
MNALKAGVTLGILVYLYQRGLLDFTRVRTVLTNPLVFFVSLFFVGGMCVAGAVRWWLLLLGQKLRVKKFETFELAMIGVFFNTAIPGAVSGDLVKGYYVVRQQQDGRGRIKAFTTLLLDRLLGLSALICVSFAAMIFNLSEVLQSPGLKPLALLISLLWFGVIGFYAFVLIEWPFSKRLTRLLRKLPAGDYLVKLFEAVKAYENCRHYVYKGMAISVAIHCSIIGVVILLAQTLGGFESVPLSKFFFLVPLGLLVTAIPIAPAGLGTGHMAFFELFKLVGSAHGADLFTAYITFQIIVSLVGGMFYLRYRGHHPKAA